MTMSCVIMSTPRALPCPAPSRRCLQGWLAPRPRSSSFFSLGMFGGIAGQAFSRVYRGALDHFHGAYGAVDSRRRGEAAVALRAISFWTSDSPWQVRLSEGVDSAIADLVCERIFCSFFFVEMGVRNNAKGLINVVRRVRNRKVVGLSVLLGQGSCYTDKLVSCCLPAS